MSPVELPLNTEMHLLYESPELGKLFGQMRESRFEIHSIMVRPELLSHVKAYREILNGVSKELKERGFTQFYTYADSLSGFNYNKLMGFRSAYIVYDNKYELMVRDIT